MNRIEIGISGWNYEGWRGTFYPAKLSHAKELEFASRILHTIEVNGTFYSLQKPTTYQHWYEQTPDDFKFSIKANRYITHIRKLNNVAEPLANFFGSGPLELKKKLGPFLWQFPPSLGFDPDRFESFFKLLPKNFGEARKLALKNTFDFPRPSRFNPETPIHHAVEVRHVSFHNPWFIEILRKYNVALVFADTAGKWPYMEDVTADFLYLRLHGDEELYVSGYDKKTLSFWADRLDKWSEGDEPVDRLVLTEDRPPKKPRDIYIYFDNDAKVRAPADAQTLMDLLKISSIHPDQES